MGIKRSWLVVAGFLGLGSSLTAQTNVSYSDIVGYVKETYNAAADSIVAPQLQRPTELTASVSSVSSGGATATLTLSGVSLIADQFKYLAGTQPKTYYVLITAGAKIGTLFTVSGNTASQITIDLDGLSLASADVTQIEVRPYWTIGTLFPASDSGVSFVASTGVNSASRRTQILIPNTTGLGVNRSASVILFFNPAIGNWASTTSTGVSAGDTIVPPNSFLILRNTGGTPPSLSHTISGAVDTKPSAVFLATRTSGQNDNPISLTRPTDYRLSEIGFTDSNFVQSLGINLASRRDQLLVLSKTGSGINRSVSKVYFRFNNQWYDSANTSTSTDAVIPAGSALFVRKAASDGFDKVVSNTPNFSNP